jgi:hypothetical protein
VLDVLSPLTLVDPGPGVRGSLSSESLTLLGKAPGGGLEIPRAQFLDASLYSLHPCEGAECSVGPCGADATCALGAPGVPGPQPYNAIIGANVLAGDALRLRLGDEKIFVLADIGGNERDRTYVCDAVFPSPYRGGGTAIISETEVSFGGRRVTLQACLGPGAPSDPTDPEAPAPPQSGADVLLVASTGIGASLLGESAYERYRVSQSQRPPEEQPLPLDMLTIEHLVMPSGPVTGRKATIERIAFAAGTSSSSRAPCRQRYAHHLLAARDCLPGEDCPCTDGDKLCAVPAIVEIAPVDEVEVLVVPDSNPTLQALRTELRPDQPEVDGILGTQAMRGLELDVDYPHNRVLMRCTSPTECWTRPALSQGEDRDQVQNCVRSGAP